MIGLTGATLVVLRRSSGRALLLQLKNRMLSGCCLANREAAKASLFDSLKVFYNQQRLH